MPLPRPGGHASLCLSAFPTTPIMHLPQLSTQWTERTLSDPGWGARIRARKRREAAASRECGLSGVELMGAEGVTGVWSGEELTFELFFNLFKG